MRQTRNIMSPVIIRYCYSECKYYNEFIDIVLFLNWFRLDLRCLYVFWFSIRKYVYLFCYSLNNLEMGCCFIWMFQIIKNPVLLSISIHLSQRAIFLNHRLQPWRTHHWTKASQIICKKNRKNILPPNCRIDFKPLYTYSINLFYNWISNIFFFYIYAPAPITIYGQLTVRFSF